MNHPECPVCWESFTVEGDNEPKVLVCGHTFCGRCLQDLKSRNCPICNRKFKEFVTNYCLRDFLTLISDHLSSLNRQQQKIEEQPKELKFHKRELRKRQKI